MAEVKLIKYPTKEDWIEVKRRALETVGLTPKTAPTIEWKINEMLRPRHSPIRYLMFSFKITNLPYYVSTHFVRHVHAQPFVRTQRNDRQSNYDRTKAPQDAPVNMIWDITGEEMLIIANKRLCHKAAEETRKVTEQMCDEILKVCPEFKDFLVPMCYYLYGHCNESHPCGYYKTFKETEKENGE